MSTENASLLHCAHESCDTDDAGFTVDSADPTLCTDEIDDVHVPQISDDAGSEGEWDPHQATSSRLPSVRQPPYGLSSPLTSSLRTVMADTQVNSAARAYTSRTLGSDFGV